MRNTPNVLMLCVTISKLGSNEAVEAIFEEGAPSRQVMNLIGRGDLAI